MSEITQQQASEVEAHHDDHHALHSDTVKIGDREITMPGGLYTLVFVVLAVVTLIEVLLAESPLPTVISYPLLAALSIGKGVLVVLYYMHLMQDSRIFAWAFGIPLGMASVIVLFVMFTQPNAGY
jgi:cytochrome c oxidase subunit IV